MAQHAPLIKEKLQFESVQRDKQESKMILNPTDPEKTRELMEAYHSQHGSERGSLSFAKKPIEEIEKKVLDTIELYKYFKKR